MLMVTDQKQQIKGDITHHHIDTSPKCQCDAE